MWMLRPSLLCNKHLLGEHGEIHKHRHNFAKCHSVSGRVSPLVLIEPANMQVRHDELALEMASRGMNHQSPYSLPCLDYLPLEQRNARADLDYNRADLMARCEACKERILNHEKTN